MKGLNKVQIIGNVGKDPETRHLENENVMSSFPVATTETYKDKKGKKQEKTEWHNVTMFGGLAEIAEEYIWKGDRVYVEGRIETRESEGSDGEINYFTNVIAREVIMLGEPQSEENEKGKSKGKGRSKGKAKG